MNWPATWRRLAAPLGHRWRWIRQATADLVLPPTCVQCLSALPAEEQAAPPAPNPWFCRPCRRLLLATEAPRCPRCAAVLPAGEPSVNDCRVCRPLAWRLSAVWSLGSYEGALRDAVLRMKHSQDEPLAAGCAELLCDRYAAEWRAFRPDVVVAAPMHWRRRWTRGTNNPELIAATIAARLAVPDAPRLLARRRHTAPQSQLSPAKRRENVHGAFRVRPRYDVRDARVLLVDDILTTGSTAHAMAAALHDAGAAAVGLAVIARAQVHAD